MIVALAWGYVLWLANDMDMGGMDMTGFRMIPAGIGIMAPANAPWRAIEFAFVFADVGGDDGRDDGALGSAHDPHVRPRGSTGESCRASRSPRPAGLPPVISSPGSAFRWRRPFVQWAIERAALLDSRMASASNCLGGNRADRGGRLSMDTAQGRLSRPMPDAVQFLMRHGGFRERRCGAACCWGFGTEPIVSAAAGF